MFWGGRGKCDCLVLMICLLDVCFEMVVWVHVYKLARKGRSENNSLGNLSRATSFLKAF